MKFEKTHIEGLWLISQTPQRDDRGEFSRIFCEKEFRMHDLETQFPQENRSVCVLMGTLRGLHMQVFPHGEQKLVRCTRGRVFDVAVDCRRGSETLLKWFGIELQEGDGKMVRIPAGFAHGYQALQDNSEITYRVSTEYSPKSEVQVHHAEPQIGIQWPITVTNLSDKDSNAERLPLNFLGWKA